MGSYLTGTVSGQGHAPIDPGAGHIVTDIAASLVTLGIRARTIGTAAPRGVRYVASYGLGCFPDDVFACDPGIVFYAVRMQWEFEDLSIPTTLTGGFAPSVWWNVAAGSEIALAVFW